MKRALFVAATLALVSACETTKPVDAPPAKERVTEKETPPIAQQEVPVVEPKEEAPKAPEAPKVPLTGDAITEVTGDELDALLALVGCPDGSRSSTGCSSCPTKLNHPEDEQGALRELSVTVRAPNVLDLELTRGGSHRVRAFAGDFAHGDADHVLFYEGCTLADDPNRLLGSSVYLVKGGELVGVIEGHEYHATTESCVFPRDARGKVHMVCSFTFSAQGYSSLLLARPHDPTKEGSEEGLPRDLEFFEVAGRFPEKGDDLVYPEWYGFSFDEVRDLDGDGDEDIVVTRGKRVRWTLTQGEGGVFEAKSAEAEMQPMKRLSGAPFDALLSRVGCPEGSRSSAGCSVCPTKLNPHATERDRPYARGFEWTSPSTFEFRGSSRSTVHAFSADFAHGGADSLLVYPGCPIHAEDDWPRRPNSLYLVAGDELVGVLEGYQDDTVLRACALPKDAAGKVHVLCIEERGRMGLFSLSVLRVHDPTTKASPDPGYYEGLKEMPGVDEVEGEWKEVRGDEELVMPDSYGLAFGEVRDLDGDGDDDLVMIQGKDERWEVIQGEGGVFVGSKK